MAIDRLILILGDQLDADASTLADSDPERDAIWMAENHEESTHVWCHKRRLVFFFSAMRHFREALRERGFTVHYTELASNKCDDRGSNFADLLRQDVARLKPKRLVVTQPGDHRVLTMLRAAAQRCDVPLEIDNDAHFYCGLEEFREWADGRKELVLEHFYREMRKRHRVLIDDDDQPVGGEWNFDRANRDSFGRNGPPCIPEPRSFRADDITSAVIDLVSKRFRDHPGSLEAFDLPVTRENARSALRDFIKHRLSRFGRYEDAMWTGHTVLYHSRLSAAFNVKLISPRECVAAALKAFEDGKAPIESVEGFVRQLIGWREFIRGIYWLHMPDYAKRNALRHNLPLPQFYWDGETDMNCLRHAMNSVLAHGYTHHIERLMVLGQFALLLGVHPATFHQWHMAMYLDAIDWVSLPNALGMSQYGDGGIVGTKPYCASGAYINRMSNYCKDCRFNPKESVGESACPFTTLYWDFLARHRSKLESNARMKFQFDNLDRKSDADLKSICSRARSLKRRLAPSRSKSSK